MKFRCDSCGKRFASVDEPFPGRVYKIRCSRCGQLLTVQAPVPWEAPAEELQLDLSEPPRAATSPAEAPPPLPARPAEETEEVPIDLALSDEFPLLQQKQRRRARRLVVAVGAVAAAVLMLIVGLLLRTATWPARPAAARPPSVAAAAPPTVVPAAAEIPSEPMPTGPAPAPAARPAPAPAPAPASPPPVAAARPPQPVERRPVADRPAAPSPAPRARVAFEGPAPADPPGRVEVPPPPLEPKVDPGLAATLLRKQDATVRAGLPDVTELREILDGRRAALDACFDYAASSAGGAAWQGRTAQLVVRVQGNGKATAAVDDPALAPTEIASCLRRTVARTSFPAFVGEAVELRTPVAIPQ